MVKWRRRPIALVALGFLILRILVLGALIVQVIFVIIVGETWRSIPFDYRCQNNALSCGLLSGIVVPLLTIALGSTIFISFRLFRVRKGYQRRAKSYSRYLVPTAGRMLERVQGRDELCSVIMDNLVDRQTRRAFVVVGGVGAGKTALLVQLTSMLAKANAIPVPVMLREVQSESGLDFRELANSTFSASVAGLLWRRGDSQRTWRQLAQDGMIVILADGLEEALIDNDERSNTIRLAIERANVQKLPLVITSRPHEPLRDMKATIIKLGPLSEEAAHSYMNDDGKPGRNAEQLDWIVETAEVTDKPLFLQITRELHRYGLLEHVSPAAGDLALQAGDAGRTQLRVHLLDIWTDALVEGYFPEGLPMSREDRRTAIECVAALACVSLKLDSKDIRFADFLGPPPQLVGNSGDSAARNTGTLPPEAGLRENIDSWVAEDIGAPGRRVKLLEFERKEPHRVITDLMVQRLDGLVPDIRVAAAWGDQLGLVEIHGNGVRFPDGILQAYLGSLMMSAALRDDKYCMEAAQKPGAEFLLSVVMYFCSHKAQQLAVARRQNERKRRQRATSWDDDVAFILALLRQSARVQVVDAKKLDVYAAALEIDSANGGLQHEEIAKEVCEHWPSTAMTYDRLLEEAKLGLVRRFGEAAHKIAKLAQSKAESENLRPHRGRSAAPVRLVPAYAQLYQIGIAERSYPIRLEVALEIGMGGDWAYDALRERFSEVRARLEEGPEATGELSDEEARQRRGEDTLCAWLAPLLAGSVSRCHETRASDRDGTDIALGDESPKSILSGWLRRPGKAPLPVSLEIALAQGFKYAANRQRQHPGARAEARAWLAEEATEMLKRSRFWFTHLTLLHALCLWAVRDYEEADPMRDRHGSQPEVTVRQWLAIAGSEATDGKQAARREIHPFVGEAARLVVLALKEKRPDKYVWIDESGVTSMVGSHAEGPLTARKHQLRIPASTGWSVLDPRAQRLVADVLLLLNLAERRDRPEDHDRRLGFTDRQDLPPCLTVDRSSLNPGRPVWAVGAAVPGSNCVDGCQFRLCPYPPWEPSYRMELSEPFCRNQQAMLIKSGHGAAPWQKMRARDLRKFWGLMADRSRGVGLDYWI
jgi:hypothetical protein